MDFILRKWEYSDGPDLQAAADNPLVARYLRNNFPSPYTEDDALKYLTYCKNTPDTLEYIRTIEVNGHASGSISLLFGSDVNIKSAELGYWLAQPFWGQGIATEAVARMVRIGFEECGLHRISADVYAPNIASQRVLEKNGFVREGHFREAIYKNGQFMDLYVYSLLRS